MRRDPLDGPLTRPVGERKGLGWDTIRIDGTPKVTGAFGYSSDFSVGGMLWGHVLRSPHPHARIRSVDIRAALASPGVRAVLVAEDLPGLNAFGLEFTDQPVLATSMVRHVGEAVALVAAEHPEQAKRAVQLIVVDYEPLPAVTDMEEALRADAPKIHPWGNVIRHLRIAHGDANAEAEVWVEGYYETGVQDQAPLGPESGLAIPTPDGGVDLYVASQWVHLDQRQIAPCLGLPPRKVRVYQAGIGGAFGAREDVNVHIHACVLALRTGRPVKMSFGREESFLVHVHRHPSRIWMRHGARRDGRLVRLEARILLDGGAYTSTSPAVTLVASTVAAGPYEIPNAVIEGTAVYTHNPPSGAMRGFGAVQACFAYEAQMDKLAKAIGLDSVELRVRNAVNTGSVLPTGQVITGTAPVRELLSQLVTLPLPEDRSREEPDRATLPVGAGNVGRREDLKRGIGYAVGYKNMSYSGGADDYSTATVTLAPGIDGPVGEVRCAASEVGQGIHTLLVQIARAELSINDVVLLTPDTSMGSAGPSSASRQTMMSGGAVQLASRAIREKLLERVREHHGWSESGPSLLLHDGRVLADEVLLGPIDRYLEEPIEATRTYHHRRTQPLDANGQGDVHVAFGFAAHRAVVEVDQELGLVRVLQIAAVHDVGRALNPQALVGQIEGGTAQGLGLALIEELRMQEGTIRNASFTDYLLPTIMDMPEVVTALIELPEPGVPFGAKGAAEHATIVAPAATAAALRDATGRALNRIPATPDHLTGLADPLPWRDPPPSPTVPGPDPIPQYFGMQSGRDVPLEGADAPSGSGIDVTNAGIDP